MFSIWDQMSNYCNFLWTICSIDNQKTINRLRLSHSIANWEKVGQCPFRRPLYDIFDFWIFRIDVIVDEIVEIEQLLSEKAQFIVGSPSSPPPVIWRPATMSNDVWKKIIKVELTKYKCARAFHPSRVVGYCSGCALSGILCFSRSG